MDQQPLFIVFIHLGLGGVERKIVDIANFLKTYRPNLPIYILLRKHSTFSVQDQIINKQVTVITYTDWMRVKVPFFFIGFILFHVWKLKPKAIVSFLDLPAYTSTVAKLLFFWRKMKVVVGSDHYASRVIANYNYPRLRLLLVKLLYPRADKIITCTEATKKDLMNSFRIPSHKIKVIKNWTSATTAKPSHAKIYDLIYVGRLDKEKNMLSLLRAVCALVSTNNKLSMLVAGDGSQRDSLQKYANEHNISGNITFVGAVKNIRQYLSKARLFIYSPNEKADGFPITILESMSAGIPVLTRYFNGADEVIQNDVNGIIVHSNKEFVQKALWLLKNPDKRELLAANAKKYVSQHHTPDNMLEYFDELNI